MTTPSWTRLRRAVAARGFTPATWIPAASEGRAEEATIRPARLLEAVPLSGHAVGTPEPWPGTVAFLDGTQRYEVMAYAGASPVVVAEIGAAVLERRERHLQVAVAERRRLVLARPHVLDRLEDVIEDHVAVMLADEGPVHPVHDFQLARREVDRARGRLEIEVGYAYRRASSEWLLVDGSLAESPDWAADPRMLGIAKSHATLPFSGDDLEAYLRLPAGWRSPVFEPAGNEVAPVYSWALRLWPWEGKDLLHGLIRIEAAPTPETLAAADRISRWLLAERSPVSTPDPRWDRLLYGIHAVEEYLRASSRR
ncbi:MAG TPA: hypothetical protein VMG41_03385 [Gemmatimonadales bacterium]|nr:hypothetical protein [Gemmatimonadales bacterium]